MLVKTKDGSATRLIHNGVRYLFEKNEVKDCPESILSGFRGVLVSAESTSSIVDTSNWDNRVKMPIIQVEPESKIKIPVKNKNIVKKK